MDFSARATTVAAGDSALAAGYLALLVVVGVALLVLFVAAVVSIATSARLTGAGKAVWVLVCLVLQLLGPLAWFLWGRKQDFSAER